jgi:arylsulfatase A-like enzyme
VIEGDLVDRLLQFVDSLMEADAIVARMLDALDELNLARDTIVVFASEDGPEARECAHSAAACRSMSATPRNQT